MRNSKPAAIICLGNPLMRDEGIGIRIAVELEKRKDKLHGAEVMDLGTGGMSILHVIAGREKVVFVDCARMGETPGTLRKFTLAEVKSTKMRMRYSLHEGDLLEILELSDSLDECPAEIVIFGIEPADISQEEGLSEELEKRVGEYVEIISNS